MYAIGTIDSGGFISAYLKEERKPTMHRETRLDALQIPYATLNAAKEDLGDGWGPEGNPEFILDYNEEGGVESLWCYESIQSIVQTRVKIWGGCYGTWKVRRLSEPNPAV